jgi:HEAT repeat protein
MGAAHALGDIGDERAVDVLLQLLKDEFKDVQVSAAYALGKIGDERGVGARLQLLKDGSWYEGIQAA